MKIYEAVLQVNLNSCSAGESEYSIAANLLPRNEILTLTSHDIRNTFVILKNYFP